MIATTILGALGSVASLATKLLGMLSKYLLYNAGKKAARSEDKIDQLELELDLKDDYKKNRDNKPTNRDDNLNRLRERAARNKKRLP